LVGLSLALVLAKTGIKITVIEYSNPEKILNKKSDGRVNAIAYSSKQIFKAVGLWNDLKKYAGEILDIRVTDSNSPLFLHYDHKDVDNEPMGYIVENRFTRKVLFSHLKKLTP